VNEFVEATFDKLGQDETIKYARVKKATLIVLHNYLHKKIQSALWNVRLIYYVIC